MCTGRAVSHFSVVYRVFITNQMLSHDVYCHEVMARFACFIEEKNLMAHNASY